MIVDSKICRPLLGFLQTHASYGKECLLKGQCFDIFDFRFKPLILFPLFATGVNDTSGNLEPMSLIQVVHHDLRKSPRIFQKVRDDTDVIFRGLGEDL